MLFRHRLAVFFLILTLGLDWVGAQAIPTSWPTKPLALADALEIALRQNTAILQGKQDIEESQGLALQLKGVYTPKIRSTGRYTAVELAKIEVANFGAPGQATNGFRFQGDQNWNADVQITQPIYAGGRLKSAQRQSKLTLDASLANYHAVVADALLQVRVAFQDLLLAAETIQVNEASIQLLEKELADTRRRFEAGVVPRFNVLRAEVELANAKPRLFRARNAQRTARNTLATVLGYTVPKEAGLEIPLEISGTLIQEKHDLSLSDALLRAMSQRTELKALRTGEKIRDEEVIQAKAGLYPNLGLFGGYGWQNKNFPHALDRSVDGWMTGAQLQWDVWDFGTTRGKVQSAKARKERSHLETQDAYRQIELQVRTAHSNFLEARDVLESQARVIEQAEEALRLATARAEAGTGTQLDVLGAQTALTQARNTYAQALRDHTVAWDRLQRAVGDGVTVSK